MNKDTYQQLRSMRVIGGFGEVTTYYSGTPYDYKEVCDLMEGQLTEKIDYKNMVVMFPISTDYGSNYFFGPGDNVHDPRKVLIDHCLFFHRVCRELEKKDIKFKNGISIDQKDKDNYKYGQMNAGSMLIVHKGVAYMVDGTANPLGGNLTFNKSKCYHNSTLNRPLCLNDTDVKKGVTTENKPLIFSGFLLRRLGKHLN